MTAARRAIGAAALAIAAAAAATAMTPSPVMTQGQRGAEPADPDQPFVEALRREDPAIADRYVALRNARQDAITALRRAEEQYSAAGAELRRIFLPQLLQARRNYAQTSLALFDFADERDRRIVAKYQEEMTRINAALEERKKLRAEFEKLLKGE